MPSPTHTANLDGFASSKSFDQNHRRPSYSPVTPTFPDGNSDADAQKGNQPDLIDEPDPLPISLDENSDAIALKAALSILQLQKQQTQRDIKQLDRMKAAANNEPEAFVDALRAGRLSRPLPQAVVDLDGDADGDGDGRAQVRTLADSENTNTDFGQFPNSQNVIRCPPINWAKYHVVGESLDKLHDEQRQRPEPGTPRRDEHGRPPQHVVAAPYRPLVDRIDVASSNFLKDVKE